MRPSRRASRSAYRWETSMRDWTFSATHCSRCLLSGMPSGGPHSNGKASSLRRLPASTRRRRDHGPVVGAFDGGADLLGEHLLDGPADGRVARPGGGAGRRAPYPRAVPAGLARAAAAARRTARRRWSSSPVAPVLRRSVYELMFARAGFGSGGQAVSVRGTARKPITTTGEMLECDQDHVFHRCLPSPIGRGRAGVQKPLASRTGGASWICRSWPARSRRSSSRPA
jgi:hypothetical protein